VPYPSFLGIKCFTDKIPQIPSLKNKFFFSGTTNKKGGPEARLFYTTLKIGVGGFYQR
jgi:hypothetical protein